MSTTLNTNIASSEAQLQQYSKNMLASVPTNVNKDSLQYQALSNQMNFSVSHRKGVSTNERQNFSSSPVKITNKAAEMSPQIPASTYTNPKLNLYQTANDVSYFKKILQSPLTSDLTSNSYSVIPQGQSRPQNFTQKYIRNFSQFLLDIQKNKQENQHFCTHCRDLLWEPVKCSECPTYYCLSCASKNYTKHNKKCNICQKILITITVEENILKQLQKISLMCPNNLSGCQAILSYNSFELHQQDCRFKKARGSENLTKPPLVSDSKKRDSVPIMPVSNPPLAKKEKKELVSCIYCYKNVARNLHEQHQNNCPLKLIACQFCKIEVPIAHMKVHVQFRCTKTIPCTNCNVNVPYEQYNGHIGNCNLYPSSKCSFCDQSFYKSSISDHIAGCSLNPVNNKRKTSINASGNSINSSSGSNKKYYNELITPPSQNKNQSTNGQSPLLNNNISTDLTSLLSKGVSMSSSPNKNGPSTEKLKFMVMDNMFKSKPRPNEYSFDHDFEHDKTAITKMNTDASMSTEMSQNNINMQDHRINALLNTSLQLNTTNPLSPLPPQSKFRVEAQAAAAAHNMMSSQKQLNLIKLQTENPESYSGNLYNSYKQNNNNIQSNNSPVIMNTFLSPQLTSSTRISSNYKTGNNQMNPAFNQILQQFLHKNNETIGGRSNSLQMLQSVPAMKTNSSNNLETKS